MKQCWRWFGPGDQIPLDDLHQVGVEGIVTALHERPPGTVWSAAQIPSGKGFCGLRAMNGM